MQHISIFVKLKKLL